VQVLAGGTIGGCIVARGGICQIGSLIGDLIVRDDPLIDPEHCLIEELAGRLLLTDLDSRTGVFVHLRGRHELVNGDELMIGRTHLVVEVEPQKER
jgi:pSer/pThr/pTyr-binding forkhead associated (FHA) protein